MTDQLQTAKGLFTSFHTDLHAGGVECAPAIVAKYLSEDCLWHGPHPLNRLDGPRAFFDEYWEPLNRAMHNLRRKDDILFAGQWENRTWISTTGHYLARFDSDWLGIPATGADVRIRYGEFACIERGRLTEFRVILDLPALCAAAGHPLLPTSRGAEIDVPPPADGSGVMDTPQDSALSASSLAIVEGMINGLNSYSEAASPEAGQEGMGQERFFHPDLVWYGPCGIGTTYGLDGFVEHHQKPFLHAFPDRKGGNHRAKLAEGHFIGSTGWPSVQATHAGDYLGVPATGRKIGMRVMDWWRAEDGMLVENWVLIDLVDLFLQLGIDLLAEKLPSQ